MTALAVAFFAVPQVSLAQAANDQAQVDPLMQKAARIQAMNAQMRVTHAQRVEAAKEQKAHVERVKAAKAAARAKGIEVPELGIRGTRAVKAGHGSTQTHARGAVRSTSATALPTPEGTPPGGVGPLDIPDYNTTANWAFSPMLKKFVHSLPGLGAGGANDLGQYIPMAHPDTTTYPGSDYYEISVRLYSWQFGGEKYDGTLLPATNVRGYVQTNDATAARRTGPDRLARSGHRRPEGPPGPHQVQERAAQRRGRKPDRPGRRVDHGLRQGRQLPRRRGV